MTGAISGLEPLASFTALLSHLVKNTIDLLFGNMKHFLLMSPSF